MNFYNHVLGGWSWSRSKEKKLLAFFPPNVDWVRVAGCLPWMLTELGLQVGLPWGKVSIAHRKKLDKFLVDGHDHDLKFVTDYYNLAKQGDIDTTFSGLMMGVFYNIQQILQTSNDLYYLL